MWCSARRRALPPTSTSRASTAANGFKLSGAAAGDFSGCSVASAGDVNGDGFADLIVGAYGADPNGIHSGASYVVFGKASGFAANLDLSTPRRQQRLQAQRRGGGRPQRPLGRLGRRRQRRRLRRPDRRRLARRSARHRFRRELCDVRRVARHRGEPHRHRRRRRRSPAAISTTRSPGSAATTGCTATAATTPRCSAARGPTIRSSERQRPAGTTFTVTDLRAGSPDGTDTLTGIENSPVFRCDGRGHAVPRQHRSLDARRRHRLQAQRRGGERLAAAARSPRPATSTATASPT